jgi:hypothetical protein
MEFPQGLFEQPTVRASRLGVHCGQAPAHAKLTAGDAAVDDAVVIYRRVSDA